MATTTVTTVSSTTTSTQLLAANVGRSNITFVNTDSNRLYILQGTGTASASNYTVYLDEDDSVDIDNDEAEQAFQGIWAGDGSGQATITQTVASELAGAGTDSILTILQERVATEIGIEVPDGVMASTVREHIELKRATNKALKMIVKAHKWQKLSLIATYTGDGSTEDFDLPDDFAFMPDDNQVWSSETSMPLCPVKTQNDWLGMTVRDINTPVPSWIIYGGQIHFKAALADGATAQHFYQSTAAVQPATGVAKSSFTLDTDTFRIDDELLALAIIYVWKQGKGQPYAENLADYETAKEKLISRDRGASIIIQGGRSRMLRGDRIAYPLNVPTS